MHHADTDMSPQVFHILLSLSAGPRHGYGIIKDISAHTEERLRLGTGTMYTALQRLLDAGWIEETPERPDPDADERRVYYRLTEPGRAALCTEAERLDHAVTVARDRHVLGKRVSGTRRS